MNEELKVGDRVEWCADGNFEQYESSTNEFMHDFGIVMHITEHKVLVEWEGLGEEEYTLKCNVRKAPVKPEFKVADRNRSCLSPASDKRLVELTQAELQFFVSLLKKEIDLAQEYVVLYKRFTTEAYYLFDANKPLTKEVFDNINHQKDALRYWKNKNNKLSAIQAKLKRAR